MASETAPIPADETTPDETTTEVAKSDAARPLKQMLAWAMGDREMEAKALAAETAAQSDLTPEEALTAATVAVAVAHGDTGSADDEAAPSSDVARPSDVAAISDAPEPDDD